MLEITASLRAPYTDRLLRPARALSRLRPVTLEAIAGQLRRFYWRYRGAQLVRIVPGVVGKYLPEDEWDDMLGAVLRQCEARDWFEVDWDLLDGDYQGWMESDEEGYFTQWLEFIPVQRFGFSDDDETWPEEYPSMALLKALLSDWGEEILVSLLDDYHLEADWTNIFQYELEERLATADFSGYERPLCWLPEMARIACGNTGHELLDFSNYFEDDPTAYCWDSDLERVKELWQTAKPSVARMREFLQWCSGPGEMQRMVDVLVGERPARPKPKRKKRASRLNTLVEILAPGVER